MSEKENLKSCAGNFNAINEKLRKLGFEPEGLAKDYEKRFGNPTMVYCRRSYFGKSGSMIYLNLGAYEVYFNEHSNVDEKLMKKLNNKLILKVG